MAAKMVRRAILKFGCFGGCRSVACWLFNQSRSVDGLVSDVLIDKIGRRLFELQSEQLIVCLLCFIAVLNASHILCMITVVST